MQIKKNFSKVANGILVIITSLVMYLFMLFFYSFINMYSNQIAGIKSWTYTNQVGIGTLFLVGILLGMAYLMFINFKRISDMSENDKLPLKLKKFILTPSFLISFLVGPIAMFLLVCASCGSPAEALELAFADVERQIEVLKRAAIEAPSK